MTSKLHNEFVLLDNSLQGLVTFVTTETYL
jgi:hypothetical protein